MRYDQKETVLAKNLKYDNLNDKLNEIMRRIELFIMFYGYSPKQILLNFETFEEIQNKRSDLFRIFDEEYYLLNMKVVF